MATLVPFPLLCNAASPKGDSGCAGLGRGAFVQEELPGLVSYAGE